MTVWVLLREDDRRPDDNDVRPSRVLGVYSDKLALDRRIDSIAKANSQYALTKYNDKFWAIGPDEDEDEGFFGNRRSYLYAVESELR